MEWRRGGGPYKFSQIALLDKHICIPQKENGRFIPCTVMTDDLKN